MKLSKRLQMNVSLVPQGARVADIGCDHGYAAIWLVETGTALRMIAMDIKAFNDEEKYYNDVDDRIRELKASKLAKNSKGILMPGEIEDGKFKASEESGVVMVLPENLKMVNDLADEMGMERISVIE